MAVTFTDTNVSNPAVVLSPAYPLELTAMATKV